MKKGSKLTKAQRAKLARGQRRAWRRRRALNGQPAATTNPIQASALSLLQDMVTRGQRAQRAIDELTGATK